MVGLPYTVDDLIHELGKDRIFYEESGGGVTFSGGEPIMPPKNSEFLRACLASCGDSGFHRSVDTSGYVHGETLLEIAELTDLFLYDLKHMDDALHRRFMGVPNNLIIENLRSLSRVGARVWVRVPLIPGINDDERNIDETARFVSSLDTDYPVYLLPYHTVGADKYRRLGQAYTLEDIEPPGEDHTENIAERMRSFGLEVNIGG
jgi:pyruvate formate lyase activating enzyme